MRVSFMFIEIDRNIVSEINFRTWANMNVQRFQFARVVWYISKRGYLM